MRSVLFARASVVAAMVGLGIVLPLWAAAPITWDCGGEGERPCSAQTDYFWDNGNLFCDRGLKATGFRVLPEISFKAYDWFNLNRADMTRAVKLIQETLPALETRLNDLTQAHFLTPVCLGVVQGGDCWTTPPIPGVVGSVIRRCYADPAGVVPGTVIGNDCWAVPPTPEVRGHRDCVLGVCGPCRPAFPGESENCTLIPSFGGERGTWITRCYADPAGVLPGVVIGGVCYAVPPVPGVPGAWMPVPDFNKPGWSVPGDIVAAIEEITQVLAMFPPAIRGIPGSPPPLSFDPGSFSTDPNIFNLADFQAQLAALKAFFSQPYFTIFEDLVNDFIDPRGSCVNDTRRQAPAASFQETWAYWALLDQQELARDEPMKWVTLFNAHNAFNNAADGYIAPNQEYSVTDQLNLGARSLALDIHWFAGQLRLCHGQASHEGCSQLDRYYSNVMKEIRNWLDAHPAEVIWIEFEDRSEGHDDYVNQPIEQYLGSKVYRTDDPLGLPRRLNDGSIDIRSRWPTLTEMRERGKQVIIAGGNAHNGPWIWTGVPGNNLASSRASTFGHDEAYRLGYGEYVDGGAITRQYLSPVDAAGNVLLGPNTRDQYETRSFLDPFDSAGYITAEGVRDRVRSGLNKIGLDMLHAQERTSQCPAAGPEVCDAPDQRIEAAIWGWKPGQPADLAGPEVAALFDSADGRRWDARNPAEVHYYACAKRRVGEALCWPDPTGQEWRITQAAGPWVEGCRACTEEFGDEGFVFAVPVNGWQNERLREAVEAFVTANNLSDADVWLRHTAAPVAGGFADCNRNGTPDDCDIASGSSLDADGDSVPDECQFGTFPQVGQELTPGVFIEGCFADANRTTPGTIEADRCWARPPSLAILMNEVCIPPFGCFCPGVRFEGKCYLFPPIPGFGGPVCYANAAGTQRGFEVNGVCYAQAPSNTTGVDAGVFSGPPDDVYSGIGGQWVMYDFGSYGVRNGAGQDFNVYEVDFGAVEFGIIDVLVSADGATFVSVKSTEGAVVRIAGDGVHGNNAYARSYDIGPAGSETIRYIAIKGAGSDPAGPQVGFDLDAIGVIHLAGRKIRCDIPADFDLDGDVDQDDLQQLVDCTAGPSMPYPAGCAEKDLNNDDAVDQSDFGLFQRCYSGANRLPTPGCAN